MYIQFPRTPALVRLISPYHFSVCRISPLYPRHQSTPIGLALFAVDLLYEKLLKSYARGRPRYLVQSNSCLYPILIPPPPSEVIPTFDIHHSSSTSPPLFRLSACIDRFLHSCNPWSLHTIHASVHPTSICNFTLPKAARKTLDLSAVRAITT